MIHELTEGRFLPHEAARWRAGRSPGKARMEALTCCRAELWAAATVTAAVAVGSAAYSASQQGSSQQDALNAAGQAPKIVPYTPPDPSQGYMDYNKLVGDQLPGLTSSTAALNSADNAAFQTRLSKTSPTLLGNIAAQGAEVPKLGIAADNLRGVSDYETGLSHNESDLASQYLTGKLPADIMKGVVRSSAFQSLSGGYAGSDAAHAGEARNLGLTSLDLESRGAALQGQANQTQAQANSTLGESNSTLAQANSTLQSNLSNTASVNPSNVTATSLLLSPQQLLARDDSNAAYANGVQNRNANIQYQNGLYQAAANGINPGANGIISGIGSLGKAFGGSGGGSGLGNIGSTLSGVFNPSYTNPNSNSYDAASAAATDPYGNYSPYLDTNSYNDAGTYLPTDTNYGGG